MLKAAVAAGADHIDTDQYYGPRVVNELTRGPLCRYPDGSALVSGVGARRDDTGAVLAYHQPHQLRTGTEDNLRTPGTEQLTMVNLWLMDNALPDHRFVAQHSSSHDS